MKDKESVMILARYLSNVALKLVFGESMQASRENAEEAARLRPVHLLTIYLTSNDMDQLALVASLWKGIPCRLIQLQPDDFFTKEQGRYDTMGIDRLATLRCAGSSYGFPILVIDGGTCLTYTAADENAVIMGGGISLGFGAELHSIVNRIAGTKLETSDLIKEATALVEKSKPLNPFPNSTSHAILSSVMGQITTNLRRVIKQYLKRVGDPIGMEEDDITPKSRCVVILGGDEVIIKALLEPSSTYFESDETMPRYQLHTMKHAAALGISFILQKQTEKARTREISKHGELMRILMGKRVAKNFPDAKGTALIFRGTITAVSDDADGSFLTMVKYDDDDVEELQPADLYGE